MSIAFLPFKYYSVLPDYSLTTKIREESWDLDQLFPILKRTKEEFRRLMKSLNSEGDLSELQGAIKLLATEILTGFKFLKLINFYDSAILYLYYKLLRHVFELCENEKRRLEKEEEKEGIKSLKEASGDIKEKIRFLERNIKGLAVAEEELVSVDGKLIEKLNDMRWRAEKRAQHEFSFEELTLRSLESLNRKVKVAAIKVKKEIPEKAALMARVEKDVTSGDVILLANLVLEAINNISKDAAYSSNLLKDFEDELDNLKKEVESLKKKISDIVGNEEKAQEITKSWDETIKHLEEEVHDILMEIFRNIFVEGKIVATHKLDKITATKKLAA